MRLPVLVTKDFKRTTLGPGQRPMVRALAEALFAHEGDVPSDRLDAFVEDVDRFLSPASKTLRFGLVVMLYAINISPLLFFRFRSFTSMSVDERVQHLERLERSKVRQLPLLVVAYKTVLTMLFYEDEEEQKALGYPGAERTRYKRRLPQASTESVSTEATP